MRLSGDTGREEMRADTVDVSGLSGNGGALAAKLKAQSFFPGMRTVQVEGANDSITGTISDALGQRGPNGRIPGRHRRQPSGRHPACGNCSRATGQRCVLLYLRTPQPMKKSGNSWRRPV